MSWNYYRCKTCGVVFREKPGETFGNLFGVDAANRQCANAACPGTDFETHVGKPDKARAAAKILAQKMLAGKRTVITGQITYSQKDMDGKIEKFTTNARDIAQAIERFVKGTPLPNDVNGKQHFHDGGHFKGHELPVPASDSYYAEYGIWSSSRGWEKKLTGERLVIGCWSDFFYTSDHYAAGSWYCFSPTHGKWGKFTKR